MRQGPILTSPLGFLQAEWPTVHEAADRAVAAAHPDPRAACFYARRALELAVACVYKSDAALRLPYQDNLSAPIHEPSFKSAAGEAVFSKARVINQLGNQAVHSPRPIQPFDALTAVRELFHVSYWLARTYARGAKPAPGLAFDANALPRTTPIPRQTIDQLQKLEAGLREQDEKLSALLADKSALDEELRRLRAEVAEAKRASAAQPDTHDYSEAETRDFFIDLLLKEAGWPLDRPLDRELEVSGMPNEPGKGFVDYVLWGDDGKPLALVEAKRTKKSAQIGQQQAKLYADCLEAQFGRRPVIFYSNGYEHWLWDDASYPPRAVQGFFKKAELELMIQRRTSRKPLVDTPVNTVIVERYYQARAIRRIGEAFERDRDRKALVVMATGAGKTRTVIALCDLLMQCNWVKRVLFLADRKALVTQAVNAFKAHLPDAAPVNLVTEKDTEGRLSVLIGLCIIGAGIATIGTVPAFWCIALGSILWGLGGTFITGAHQAWLADEIGEAESAPVYMRATQLGQIGSLAGIPIAVVLAWRSLQLPLWVSGAGFFVLAGLLVMTMSERGYRPVAWGHGGATKAMWATLRDGVATVRRRAALLAVLVIIVLYGMSSEALGRLTPFHLLDTVGLPPWLEEATWFGVLTAGTFLGGAVVTGIVRRNARLHAERPLLRILLVLTAAMTLGTLVFALAGAFWLALVAAWLTRCARVATRPLALAWVNRGLAPATRATVLSMLGQAESLGEITGAPVLGVVATLHTVRLGLVGAALVLLPAFPLYGYVLRRDAKR